MSAEAATVARSAVFDSLPGIETPVDDVRRALADMWDADAGAAGGKNEPSEFRASQMNLVVHFGLNATPEQAKSGFDVALSFSRRYPCRIIALCPRALGGGGDITAKIFCECFIGSSQHDMTCTEAIILTYPLEARAYLEDQASILLETDLPLFYWPQHIAAGSRLADYAFFLKNSQRVVIDTAIERPDVAAFAWPRPEVVRDLAWGRVLPVRQSMGHFLSYIEPGRLIRGLQRIELRHRPEFRAEGRAIDLWMQRGIAECIDRNGKDAGPAPRIEFVVQTDEKLAGSLAVVWSYADRGRLTFNFDFERGAANLESSLDCEPNRVGATIRLLPPDRALAEVLFF